MKKNIHPKYTEATITCACGNVIKTRSTVKAMSVNTCAACHPYFTGQQTLVDTEGRIDQFRKRYGNFLKKLPEIPLLHDRSEAHRESS